MDIDEFLDKEVGEKSQQPKAEASSTQNPEKPESFSPQSGNPEGINQFLKSWSRIYDAKLNWDSTMYNELAQAAEKAKQEIYNYSAEIEIKKKEVKRLIGKALDEIDKKNYEEANKIYSEIGGMMDKMPDFMMEEKKELDKEIIVLSQRLHEGINHKFTADFWGSMARIENLLKDALLSFEAADLEKARLLYDKSLEEYKGLPKGFMQKKLELGEKLLKLYKDLSIQMQIKDLQQQLSIRSSIYKGINGYESLKRLADKAAQLESSGVSQSSFAPPSIQTISDRTLLNRLILRKLDRARINLKKELYQEAKRNLDSVLRVDPENKEAKKMLGSIPIQA